MKAETLPACHQTGLLTAERKKRPEPGRPAALVIYCCVTNCPQQSSLKQHTSDIDFCGSGVPAQPSRVLCLRVPLGCNHGVSGLRCHPKSRPGRSPCPSSLGLLANSILWLWDCSPPHMGSHNSAACFFQTSVMSQNHRSDIPSPLPCHLHCVLLVGSKSHTQERGIQSACIPEGGGHGVTLGAVCQHHGHFIGSRKMRASHPVGGY